VVVKQTISAPAIAEVEKVWSCFFTPPYIFRVWCLRHRNIFSLAFRSNVIYMSMIKMFLQYLYANC